MSMKIYTALVSCFILLFSPYVIWYPFLLCSFVCAPVMCYVRIRSPQSATFSKYVPYIRVFFFSLVSFHKNIEKRQLWVRPMGGLYSASRRNSFALICLVFIYRVTFLLSSINVSSWFAYLPSFATLVFLLSQLSVKQFYVSRMNQEGHSVWGYCWCRWVERTGLREEHQVQVSSHIMSVPPVYHDILRLWCSDPKAVETPKRHCQLFLDLMISGIAWCS